MSDWLEQETRYLLSEKKRKEYSKDTYTMIQYLLILLPLLVYAMTMDAKSHTDECVRVDNSLRWSCQNCGTNQWTSKRDWNDGDVSCSNCGTRLGQYKYIDEDNADEILGSFDGIFWTCKRCRVSQWSNKRDWQGWYYCVHCGVRAGDE